MKTSPATLLICVVDDDDSVRDGTASLLRSAGYATASYASAEAFLASSERTRCACVVADVQMPGMSGIDLAGALGADPPLPVILMTARTEPEVLAAARASRAAFLLRKPYAAQRLLECVQSVLR